MNNFILVVGCLVTSISSYGEALQTLDLSGLAEIVTIYMNNIFVFPNRSGLGSIWHICLNFPVEYSIYR